MLTFPRSLPHGGSTCLLEGVDRRFLSLPVLPVWSARWMQGWYHLFCMCFGFGGQWEWAVRWPVRAGCLGSCSALGAHGQDIGGMSQRGPLL